MNLVFTPQGREDYTYWELTDRQMLRRINRLINDTIRTPFTGIGKPEPLKQALAGLWSRRIDGEHRLVYQVSGNQLIVHQARYRYEK